MRDFDGDEHADLGVACGIGTFDVLLGLGDGTFGPAVSYGAGLYTNALAAGDLDGDGREDVVVTEDPYLNVLLRSPD